jgi:antibiotic biosynthesis monooxygenase (ABM) superfamily enzyme
MVQYGKYSRLISEISSVTGGLYYTFSSIVLWLKAQKSRKMKNLPVFDLSIIVALYMLAMVSAAVWFLRNNSGAKQFTDVLLAAILSIFLVRVTLARFKKQISN